MNTCFECSTIALVCLLGACVGEDCPEGSREIDGICKAVDDHAGGDGGQDGGLEGTEPDAGAAGDAAADASDLGSSDAATGGGRDAAVPVRCEDLDCDDDAHCDDSETDARCVCDEGYEGDGTSCDDVDECDAGDDDCDDHAACTNTPGSFSCECEPGYEGDGTSCEANPCEPRVDPCDADTSACEVESGDAVCVCNEGRDRCDDDPHACTTDLTNDEDHCGACDAACAGNLACEDGACEQKVVDLELGSTHSCALASDGEILCWGLNDVGQLARPGGSTAQLYEPAPTKHGAARLLGAGPNMSCAVLVADEELMCFGFNTTFKWVSSTGAESGDFSLGTGLGSVDAIDVGVLHACVLDDGAVDGWGVNGNNVLGGSAVPQTSFPMRIERADGVSSMAAGLGVCAVGTDSRVRCWGNGVATPTEVEDAANDPIEDVLGVSVSQLVSTGCAVLGGGRVLCWGANASGQLGNVAVSAASSAVAVVVTDEDGAPIGDIEQVSVGGDFACALRADGAVLCWGRSDRLGNGGTGSTPQRFATEVSDVDDAIEIAAGANHACLRRRSGQVQCWGDNAYGRLGVNPVVTSAAEPVNVLGLP